MRCRRRGLARGAARDSWFDDGRLRALWRDASAHQPRRGPRQQDIERYEAVYANELQGLAAPTAGLHFTEPLIQELQGRGIAFEHVTLHVGAGTFQPVRVANITEHVMHKERFRVPKRVADAANSCRRQSGRLVAISTTTCRSLETQHRLGEPRDGGFGRRPVSSPGQPGTTPDELLTNFHLPKSTLLMLVASSSAERTLAL